MAGLDVMRFLGWWIKVSGLLPIQVNFKGNSLKGKIFSFTFRHPSTWWFIAVLAMQIALYILLLLSFESVFGSILASQSTIVYVTALVYNVGIGIIFSCPRLLLFGLGKMARSMACIKQADESLKKMGLNEVKINKLRIAVISFNLTILVLGFCLSSFPFFQVMLETLGPTRTYTIAATMFLIAIQTQAFYMQFHMCFYAIAVRIDLMTSSLSQQRFTAKKTSVTPSSIEMIADSNRLFRQHLKKLNHIHFYLSRSAEHLSSVFSPILLVTISVKIITLISAIFLLINSLHSGQKTELIPSTTSSIIMDSLLLLFIFRTVDMPLSSANKLRQSLMISTHGELGENTKLDVITLLMQLSKDNFRVSAGGMFRVGMHLVPSLIGAVLTYVIILVQVAFRMGD